MARRQGRKKIPEPENGERWLITYSDLITLLMIFFVIMYAMSKIDVAKFETLQQSLSAALHQQDQIPLKNLGTTGLVVPSNPSDQGDMTKQNVSSQQAQAAAELKNNQALDNLYKEVQSFVQQHNLAANVQVYDQKRGIQITLRDVVLFDSGQATVKPQAEQLLKSLTPFFQSVNNPIVVEGYTDNVPITTGQYPTNWELSSARAIGVVRYFASIGVDPTRLSGVGYGEYHPAVPNDTLQHRQENRRINIVVMRYLPDTENVTPGTLDSALSNSTSASGASGDASGNSSGTASGSATSGPAASGGASSGVGTSGGTTPINPIAPITPIQPIQSLNSSAGSQ